MASGTLEVIAELAIAQANEGHRVHVAHSCRPETPADGFLDQRFPSPISRSVLPMASAVSVLSDLRACLALRRLVRQFSPNVLHLHSSKAGAVGRIALLFFRGSPKVFYSPHGFSFLRRDVSSSVRLVFRMAEFALSRMNGFIVACSPSEAAIAKRVLRIDRVFLVENAVAMAALPVASHGVRERPVVVSSGRLCYQKAPWRFFALARELSSHGADFVWIGDGPTDYPGIESRPIPENVRITGWVPRESLVRILAESDVYALLSLWEGMPLVLIEAQAIGLPAVVSDSIGSKDVIVDGETGFVCETPEVWTRRVSELLESRQLRLQQGLAARSRAREKYDVPRMHRDMMSVYTSNGFT
jgi:glycosyltransferase involved in cell wall biosynthesis